MSAPTRRALLGGLAAGVASPLVAAAAGTPGGAPRIVASPSRVRAGHPIALGLDGADAVAVAAGDGVLEVFETQTFSVASGACAFNAPVLLATGPWAPLICRPLRHEAGAGVVWGAPVTVWVQALPRHFGG